MEVDAPNVALPAQADADTWRRRIGHIQGALNKTDDNGASFKGGALLCDVSTIGTSTQQAHPKTATLNTEQPFEPAYTDLFGPTTATALGGFRYVNNSVDQKTKWKETLLLKPKAEAAESLYGFSHRGWWRR